MTFLRLSVAISLGLLMSGGAPAIVSVNAQVTVIAEALARYSKGDWAGVETLPAVDVRVVRAELARFAPDLIASIGPIRARHLLAAFSSEVAARSTTRATPADVLELIEFGCVLVRGHTGPTDAFDTAWFSVYLANVEGIFIKSSSLISFHLEHVQGRLPNHPDLPAARALVLEREMHMWGDGGFARILPGGKPAPLGGFRGNTSKDVSKDAIRAYKGLTTDASFGPEARSRMGRIQVGTGQYRDALTTLGVPTAGDPGVQYWSALFRGIAKRELGEISAAAADFREALKIAPRASSATIALAGALFLQGELDESRSVTGELRSGPGTDPWYSYWFGSFRRIDLLLDAMRSHLK